jgi:NADH-quinone oxidoreductase subunit H
VTILQVSAFMLKTIFFTYLQVAIRFTLPRFRYDQLMRLGWQGLLPLALLNVGVSALVLLLAGRAA